MAHVFLPGQCNTGSHMKLTLKVYGIDGDDAAELKELLWSLPEISDVKISWRTRDSLPLGTIHASVGGSVVKYAITYVALKFTDEALKDAYRLIKGNLVERIETWRDEKNAYLEPRYRLHFTLTEDGELVIRHDEK